MSLLEFESKLSSLVYNLHKYNERIPLVCIWFMHKGTPYVRLARSDTQEAWYFIRVSDGQMFGVTDWHTPNFDVNFWTLDTYLMDLKRNFKTNSI